MDWILSVAFSPDGKFIVSSSDDMTIRMWYATAEVCCLAKCSPQASKVWQTCATGQVPPATTSSFGRGASEIYYRADMSHHGWLIGPDVEFLSWIPPYMRPWSPASPDTKFVITGGSCVDISDAIHGQEWQAIKDRALCVS